MRKNKWFNIVAGLLTGAGVGICIGVASSNVLAGVLVGLGLGLCFSVSFNSTNRNK